MVSAVGAEAVGEKSVTAFSFLLARIRAPVLSDRDVYVSVNEQVLRALCENHRGLRVPVSPSTQTRACASMITLITLIIFKKSTTISVS